MIMMPYGRCRSSLQLTGTQTSGTPQAGPPASAGPDPGRGPGRRDDGPAHARLAGGSGGPDRRPGSRGGRGPPGHAVRKGRLLPPGPPAAPSHPGGREPWAVRASGYAARGRRPSTPTSGRSPAWRSRTSETCSRGTHRTKPQEESARAIPGRAGPRRPHAGVSARTTCCKSNDSRHDQFSACRTPPITTRRVLENVLRSLGCSPSTGRPVLIQPPPWGPAPVPEGELIRCPGRAPGGRMGDLPRA
jgi:hypothetical protein